MRGPSKARPRYFVHESSFVDAGATIGKDTKIWHFCHIMPGAVIGERCNLGQNVVVMSGVRLGNNVKVQNNVSIYEGVELEDDVLCGPSMVFTNVMNPRSHVGNTFGSINVLMYPASLSARSGYRMIVARAVRIQGQGRKA